MCGGDNAGIMSITPGPRNLITDAAGLSIGKPRICASAPASQRCSPIDRRLPPVSVRNGPPGTRETDALDPSCLVETVDAVVLSGGSASALEAAETLGDLRDYRDWRKTQP
jgi:L-aminopeptidase/D-esterase-like protein